MLVIGLTGGIGSGKTTVTRLFAQQFGIPIIDTDVIARELVLPGEPALQEITQHFGEDVLSSDGSLNRPKLRQIIFNHPDKRQQLEAILHPKILDEVSHQLEQLNSEYCIVVIPLLRPSHDYDMLERVLVIDTSRELQIQRTISRDNTSQEEVEKILDSQLPRHSRLQLADDVIENTGDLPALEKQVSKLHSLYIKLAGK